MGIRNKTEIKILIKLIDEKKDDFSKFLTHMLKCKRIKKKTKERKKERKTPCVEMVQSKFS